MDLDKLKNTVDKFLKEFTILCDEPSDINKNVYGGDTPLRDLYPNELSLYISPHSGFGSDTSGVEILQDLIEKHSEDLKGITAEATPAEDGGANLQLKAESPEALDALVERLINAMDKEIENPTIQRRGSTRQSCLSSAFTNSHDCEPLSDAQEKLIDKILEEFDDPPASPSTNTTPMKP